MSCKYINNNRESLIYDQLNQKYGSEKALEILTFLESDQFIKDFGDYIEMMQNPSDLIPEGFKNRINEYFEPLLEEDDIGLFYLDKTFTKQYLDISESELNDLFKSQRAVNSLVELTASNFINDRGIGLMSEELDFISDKVNISLKDSLQDYILKLGTELSESENTTLFLNGLSLLELLENEKALEELRTKVVDHLKSKKLVYSEELNNEDVDLSEEEVRDHNFTKASFEINTKSKVRANVKLILSLIKDPTSVEPDFGQSLPIDYTSLYNKLTNLLKDNPVTLKEHNGELVVEDLFNTYIDVLKDNVENIQYLKPLIEFLEKINSLDSNTNTKEGLRAFSFKAGFVQAFNLSKNYFNTKEISTTEVEITPAVKEKIVREDGVEINRTVKEAVKGEEIHYNSFDASKDTSTRKDLLNSWKTIILNSLKMEETITEVSEISKSIIDKLKVKSEVILKDKTKDLSEKVNLFLNEILPELGIVITKDEYTLGINKLSNNLISETDFNNRQLEFLEEVQYIVNNVGANHIQKRDLFKKGGKILNDIADAILYFRLDGSESSTYTGNKTKYNYSNPSYLHNEVNSWKKDENALNRIYSAREVWSKQSLLAKHLLALEIENLDERSEVSKKRIANFNIVHFNVYRDKSVKNSISKDNKLISKAEYIKDTINGLLYSKKGSNNLTQGRTTTAPGKSTQFEMIHDLFVDSGLVYYNGEYDLTTMVNVLQDYLNAEFERMKTEYEYVQNEKNKNKLDVYYHTDKKGQIFSNDILVGNAFKSQLFPSLSFDKISNTIKQNSLKPLYNKDGSINFENLPFYEVDIRNHIEGVIKEQLDQLKKDLIHYNIIELSEEGIYRNKGIDSSVLKTYSPSGVIISENNLQKLLGDLFLNGTINHIEYSKMFSGDVAYYKDPVDYIKRIGASYSDGIYEYLSEKTKDFNIGVTESVEIVTNYLEELKEVIKSDENLVKEWTKLVNSADAQAWITPQRWRDILIGTSKFTDQHIEIYNKMMSGQILNSNELKIVAQPLKGVYFNRDAKGKPMFLKYSQAVLIPQLVSNSKLKDLSLLMKENKVDELLTFDAIKAGSLTPTMIHDEQGNPSIYDESGKVKKLNTMTLDSRGWKLQQDLPTKGFKELPIGTQLLRNMLLLISDKLKSDKKIFERNGTQYSAEEYAKLIDDTLGNLISNNYEKLLKEFDIDSEGVIGDIDAFYNTLADELISREVSDEIVKAMKAKLSIFAFPGLKSKLDNIFSSIVKKRTVDIKTNGGAFIQMSNFGLSKQEADSKYGEGIKWHPSLKPGDTTRPYRYKLDENGEKVKNIFGEYVIEPEQILLSGSFISKYIPDYQKYPEKELFKMIDERILNNIIGYRIPNQGPSSNGALQVVGILPDTVGDTIVAFTGITKKTGSDKISLFDPV